MRLLIVPFSSFEDLSHPAIGSGTTIGNIIALLIPYIFYLAGFVLLLYLVYGGFQYLTSLGNPEAVAHAKGNLTNAIVGFIIIFVAYWIVQVVATVLGLGPILTIF